MSITVALLILSGCSDSADPLSRNPVTWEELADGSKFASDLDDDVPSLVRCWPEERGLDCLAATSMGGEWTSIKRHELTELPKQIGLDFLASGGGGYSCTVGTSRQSYHEEIWSADKGRLTSNVHTIMGNDGPWTREFVETYLRENKVPVSNPWFNCLHVGEALWDGSLASLGTTSISKDQLFQFE